MANRIVSAELSGGLWHLVIEGENGNTWHADMTEHGYRIRLFEDRLRDAGFTQDKISEYRDHLREQTMDDYLED